MKFMKNMKMIADMNRWKKRGDVMVKKKKIILISILTTTLITTIFNSKLMFFVEANNITQEIKSRIIVIPTIEESNIDTDNFEPKMGKGFIYKPASIKWVLEIINIGNDEAQDIEIRYTITAYKHDIKYGIDEADILCYRPIVYKEESCTISINKLMSSESRRFEVFSMGVFPLVDLNISSIRYNDNAYHNQYKTTHRYTYYEFDLIEDNQHLRKLLGL